MKNYWNEVVRITNNDDTPLEIKKYGKMILGQYNTASGPYYLKDSLRLFAEENKSYLKQNLK